MRVTPSVVRPLVTFLALAVASFCALVACPRNSRPSEEPTDEELVSEPLPLPAAEELAAEELAAEEPAAEELAAEEPADAGAAESGPDCRLSSSDAETRGQLRAFRRWLQDQSVGRRLVVEELEPICGDREGFLVMRLCLSGPAGGLQSLSRALSLYYPGSSWTALEYERLEGAEVPLRLEVEVNLPSGATPQPRCTWDPDTSCE